VIEYFLPKPCADRAHILANIHAMIDGLSRDVLWEITAKPYEKPGTAKQYRALFGVAYQALRQQTGNEIDDLHTYFCGEFFGWTTVAIMGKTRAKPIRTTTHDETGAENRISAKELASFYEFIQRRAAEQGYSVPDPNPLWFMEAAA